MGSGASKKRPSASGREAVEVTASDQLQQPPLRAFKAPKAETVAPSKPFVNAGPALVPLDSGIERGTCEAPKRQFRGHGRVAEVIDTEEDDDDEGYSYGRWDTEAPPRGLPGFQGHHRRASQGKGLPRDQQKALDERLRKEIQDLESDLDTFAAPHQRHHHGQIRRLQQHQQPPDCDRYGFEPSAPFNSTSSTMSTRNIPPAAHRRCSYAYSNTSGMASLNNTRTSLRTAARFGGHNAPRFSWEDDNDPSSRSSEADEWVYKQVGVASAKGPLQNGGLLEPLERGP